MGTRARRFFARFNRLEFSAPLLEASSGHPELFGQLIDAFTALHPLYGHALKLPGISLSSLHWCFLSRRVCPSRLCQFKGSFHCRLHPSDEQFSTRALPRTPFLDSFRADGEDSRVILAHVDILLEAFYSHLECLPKDRKSALNCSKA